MTDRATAPSYREEDLPVKDLEIDLRIQRHGFKPRTVEKIKRNFNENAMGIITVSQRNAVTFVIVDGWHRWEAKKQLTDNAGTIRSRIFTGLTLAQEAQMFLDLNPGNQPNALDKYRVSQLVSGSTEAAIDAVVHHYGWAVRPSRGQGSLQCVRTLERIWKASQRNEADVDILNTTLMIATRAWSTNPEAGSGPLLEGLANFLMEYRSRVNVDRLIEVLANFPGGPGELLENAQSQGRTRRMRTVATVSSVIVDEYNRGLRHGGPNELPAWRKR